MRSPDADSHAASRRLVVPLLLAAVPWCAAVADDAVAGVEGTGLASLLALVAAAGITALGRRLDGGVHGPVWRTHARRAAGPHAWAVVGAVMQGEGLTAPLGRTLLGAAGAAMVMNLTTPARRRRVNVREDAPGAYPPSTQRGVAADGPRHA